MTDSDRPIPLAEAVDIYFPGLATVATLRSAARRGVLATYRIGKRIYTTHQAMSEYIASCRVEPKARGYILTKSGKPGLSETEQAFVAQAALEQTLQALKKPSQSTSPTSTGRRRQAIQ